MTRNINPFGQLLGITLGKLPSTTRHTLVVAGQKIDDERQIEKALGLKGPEAAAHADDLDKAEAARLKAEKRRAYNRAQYQQQRQDPEAMAKRRAWDEAHKEDRQRYRAEWKQRNPGRHKEQARAWAKKNYHSNPEAMKAKSRAWYAANRDKVLARAKAKRDAQRDAKKAQREGAAHVER
jgi:hypothetical protein